MDYEKLRPSCRQCRASKRRCDKKAPACSLCLRKGYNCTYTRRSRAAAAQDAAPQTPHDLQASHVQDTYQQTSIGINFVDSALFSKWQMEIPRIEHWLTDKVREIIRNIEGIHEIAESYFAAVHISLPIISKQRFYNHLLGPMSRDGEDLYLLSLCMKLMISCPDDICMRCYRIAKEALAKGISARHLSLSFIQSSILIAVFELSHGLFPAAYLSVGLSARLGTALGCDAAIMERCTSTSGDKLEEERRAWWAILIMDRFVTLGCPQRPLATPNPPSSSLLPIDDELWDQGHMGQLPERLDSALALNLGKFARLAQSARLLTQTIDICRDFDMSSRDSFAEVDQLCSTLIALVRVYDYEGSQRRLEFCAQSAVCYSAVLTLRQLKSSSFADQSLQEAPSLLIYPDIREVISALLNVLPRATEEKSYRRISPFLLFALYKAAMSHVNQNPLVPKMTDYTSFQAFRTTLKQFSSRWKVAGLYSDILDRVEGTTARSSVF